MSFILLGLFSGLLTLVVPIVIIVWIVRLIVRHEKRGANGKRRNLNFHELIIALLIVGAGYTGLVAINFLPIAFFGEHAKTALFAGRLVLGVLLLLAGLVLKEVVGVFLMVMGISGMVMASPFIFENLGSAGALIAVVLAFIGLIVAAIKMQGKQHGQT